MFVAWLAGFVMGVAGSIPVAGPTTMLVLSFGLQGHLRSAGLVAIGSALPEGVWAALALWGFGALLRTHAWVGPASEVLAIGILLAVGALLLLRPPPAVAEGPPREPDASSDARTFLLGLSLTGLNPTLVFNWGAAVTLAVSLGAVAPSPGMAIPFGVGVVSGIVAWFFFVLHLIGRHHRRISEQARGRILGAMGIALIALGLLAAARLVTAGG
jgi:threonine/homoserine/homoserine lactone efflux protein